MTEYVPREEYEALEAKVDALQNKLNNAIERIDELEDGGNSHSGGGDQYMNALLEHTEIGERYPLLELCNMLKRTTNISREDTAKGHVKRITKTEYFEPHPHMNQNWVRTEVGSGE